MLAQVVAWLESGDPRHGWHWDLVVLDSPASGHSVPLLAAPGTVARPWTTDCSARCCGGSRPG